MGVSRKESTPNFPVCVSGGKKGLFFGKLGVLCFIETPVLRFALLPYYRRFLPRNEAPSFTHLPCKILLGSISLMSTKFLLYFHEKKHYNRGDYVKSFENKSLSVMYDLFSRRHFFYKNQ